MEGIQGRKRRITNDELFHLIDEEPGLSKYELSKKLRWSMGKTDGAITRLMSSETIFIKEIERDGRKVSLIFPKHMIPNNTLLIPKSELEIGNPIWSKEAFFYGLDSETIGISGKNYEAWNEAKYQAKVITKDDGNEISINIPKEFQSFYNLSNKHFSISLNSNRVILTITGNLVV